ncbi:MAG: hypothetical protein HC844_19465, partial [Tabrizicola sp.]|nr:hypothetical protein [Tabrizicola sp.]
MLHVYDSAYYYNELSRGLVEDIYSTSNNRQIALLETVYEVDMKNNQIARLALDKKNHLHQYHCRHIDYCAAG